MCVDKYRSRKDFNFGFTWHRTQVPSSESPRVAKILASTVASVIPKSYYNDPDQSYPYYTIYDDDVSIYKDDGKTVVRVDRSDSLSLNIVSWKRKSSRDPMPHHMQISQ